VLKKKKRGELAGRRSPRFDPAWMKIRDLTIYAFLKLLKVILALFRVKACLVLSLAIEETFEPLASPS
jgi:hypothetical protein